MATRRMIVAMLAALALPIRSAAAQDKIKVVATFSILADFARVAGGDRVDVTALVGPNSDTHVYAPSPADARALGEAALVVMNGLGFEGWIERLIKASSTRAAVVVATRGLAPRRLDGGRPGMFDPHAWQSVANAKLYVANIRDALAQVDPGGTAIYTANAAAYAARLDSLDAFARKAIGEIPPDRRKVITTHDAFGYFADAYQIEFIAPQGVSTEAQPSAREVARIIGQIRAQKIPALFLENVTDPRMLERISRETGARIGGELYSDALTDATGPAPTYVDMIRHNVGELVAALQ